MKRITYILLILIVFLGGFLRIYNLSNSPPSLNWDEAALGYNAYSISKTLKDEYGELLPVFTRSFDEYKSTLPLYLMIPSIQIFGLNEFAVRLPSAILGTLTIILVFYLAKHFFKDENVGLLSSFVFAIEPWAVHLSRVYQEANVALFFLLLGLLLYFRSKESNYLLIFSVVSLMLSMFTYNANKILVPLLLMVFFVLYKKSLAEYPKNIKKLSIALLAVFFGVFILLALKGQTFARVGPTNVFHIWARSSAERQLGVSLITRISNFLKFGNLYDLLWVIGGHYLAYFSPPNLFVREPQEPSTILAGNSIFHPFEFIFWLIGLVYIIRNSKKHVTFLAILLLSPLPAILAWNWFQPGRVMALFTIFSILIGVAVVKIFNYFSEKLKIISKPLVTKKILYFSFILYGLVSSLYLFDSINVQLPVRDPGHWQPGFRETVPQVMQLEKDYQQVIIETPQAQPYIFYLFYGKYPPEKYLKELDLVKIGTPRKVYDFGKFKFRKIYWPEDRNLKDTLFVGNEENLPQKDIETQKEAKVIREVKDRWGNTIAKLVATE